MLTQIKRNLELPFGRNMAYIQEYSSGAKEADIKQAEILTCKDLWMLFGSNYGNAAVTIQVHDTATVPANGATPTLRLRAAANQNWGLELDNKCWSFAHGIYVCASTTDDVLTLSGKDFYFHAQAS